MSTIYAHRSGALHAGTPFPHPMCLLPFPIEEVPPEVTAAGLGMGAYGAVWLPEAIPMTLHTFEYIARGAING